MTKEKAFKKAIEWFYDDEGKFKYGPINAVKEEPEICKTYMRLVYFSWRTLYKDTPIPTTIEELEKWEEENIKNESNNV